MENYCPPKLAIVEHYAIIMEQPRIDYYKDYFADKDEEYRSCSIIIDEDNIKIERPENFAAHYDPVSDTLFSNLFDKHVTTYMVKGLKIGWWFIIQILFHAGNDQDSIEKEIHQIRKLIVEQLNLKPYVYIGDLVRKY
jgi:hypothetical protein